MVKRGNNGAVRICCKIIASNSDEKESPVCFDRVAVLWESDEDSISWWTAEVVIIAPAQGFKFLASATIQYDGRPDY